MKRPSETVDPRINEVTQKVIKAAQDTLGDKLEKVILFGSYARGDFDEYSDVDFCVLAKVPNEDAWKWDNGISEKIPYLGLEHDIIVSVHVTASDLFHQYADDLPYFTNIINEGIPLAIIKISI
ncbi:MAG: nucleotidyltransferase domain-containing protein [Defluviitaleaceae bacterium]|nr:nucleotidyltransferase domain-containing protein [Defluviitaleaceae bacterium]